jgi:hypothetical protein
LKRELKLVGPFGVVLEVAFKPMVFIGICFGTRAAMKALSIITRTNGTGSSRFVIEALNGT